MVKLLSKEIKEIQEFNKLRRKLCLKYEHLLSVRFKSCKELGMVTNMFDHSGDQYQKGSDELGWLAVGNYRIPS